jgi:hypothetical protein
MKENNIRRTTISIVWQSHNIQGKVTARHMNWTADTKKLRHGADNLSILLPPHCEDTYRKATAIRSESTLGSVNKLLFKNLLNISKCFHISHVLYAQIGGALFPLPNIQFRPLTILTFHQLCFFLFQKDTKYSAILFFFYGIHCKVFCFCFLFELVHLPNCFGNASQP